ncbi:MAG: 4Fe-4S domain-containing protein [Actinomycetota bacterium]
MALKVRIDRHRCIGAGNCITIAPTAFDWLKGELYKADVVGAESIDEELLREAAASCPTQAIEIEEVEELLPWQLRGRPSAGRRVEKTFMFTDIVKSTNLVEALGDDAWTDLLRWHNDTLRGLFSTHHGEEIGSAGDGFFVGFDGPEEAIACAVAIQRKLAEHRKTQGFAPQVRIGLHATGAAQVGKDFRGIGVHEAARIAALAEGGEILASISTVGDSGRYKTSDARTVALKGISEPVEIAAIDWR